MMDDFYALILFNTKKPQLGNNVDPKWLDYRLDLFRRYTLKSLLNQTGDISRIWMLCSPESEGILAPKIKALKEKYLSMALVDFIFNEKAACDKITPNSDPIYFLKIDSDDIYRSDTIERTWQLLGYNAEISLLMFCNGFIYDLKTKELSKFTRWSICSYAVYYPSRTFDHASFLKYCVCDQTKVRDRFNPRLDMSNALFCLNHDRNLHNDPRREGIEGGKRTGKGPAVTQELANALLKEFGVAP